MKYLVMTREHGLLPVAHRLTSEGHDVEAIVQKERFEGAWGGKLHKILRNSKGQLSAPNLEPVAKSAIEAETVVLTDIGANKKLVSIFEGAPYLHATLEFQFHGMSTAIGGWWDGGAVSALHLLVFDVGVWPGGLGPALPGGCTLVRIDTVGPEFEALKADLEVQLGSVTLDDKPTTFRGLFNFGFGPDENGTLQLGRAQFGWPYLQTQAFLSEVEKFGDVLLGQDPVLPEKFVTVIPVSMPPWPCGGSNAREVVIQPDGKHPALPPMLSGSVFWHDIRVDEETQSISTAGLDGFVSVHRGAGSYPETARGKALAGATALQLPEKQYRPDAGTRVPVVLTQLEHLFGIVV